MIERFYVCVCDAARCGVESPAAKHKSYARGLAKSKGWFIGREKCFCPTHAPNKLVRPTNGREKAGSDYD